MTDYVKSGAQRPGKQLEGIRIVVEIEPNVYSRRPDEYYNQQAALLMSKTFTARADADAKEILTKLDKLLDLIDHVHGDTNIFIERTWATPDFDDLPEERQTFYHDKAAELLDDLWYCSRVWEAWHVGTMTQHDFHAAAEEDDIVADTARALYELKEV